MRQRILQTVAVSLLASPVTAQSLSPEPPEQTQPQGTTDTIVGADAPTEPTPVQSQTPPAETQTPPANDAPPVAQASPGAASEAPMAARDVRSRKLWRLADRTLADGVEDLAIELAFAAKTSNQIDERQLLERAHAGWALAVQLTRDDGRLILRLVGVAPGERMLRTMVEEVTRETLVVTLLRMLRDLYRTAQPERPQTSPTPQSPVPAAPRESDGRAYLAVTGALVGGYVGFSLEHIAGSSDATLIYPLMTLGAGIGVGASLVAADEWQVTTGEAWYLSGTTLWSTTSALLISDGVGLKRASNRHAWGLLGTATGLSLGTLAISTSEVGQGGALLTHSGAVFGGVFGALSERFVEADVERRPTLGLGVGLAAGTLAAGFVATQIPDPQPTRLVYIDLSAFLGGLTGAAGASPVLVGDEVTSTETRIWVGSVFAGTVLGGILGYALTADVEPTGEGRHLLPVTITPMIVQLDSRERRGGPWALGLRGQW